jgi:hypothetical protein
MCWLGIQREHSHPNNPLVQAVLTAILDSGKYLFMEIGPEQNITAFRSEIGQDNLIGLKDNLTRIQNTLTNDIQYQKALRQFQKYPFPPGELLTWVCHDNIGYIDLTNDRTELMPTGEAMPAGNDAHVMQRRILAERLNGKVNDLMQAGVGDDLTLLAHMAPEMSLFKRLMDISGDGGMNDLWDAYPGLYRFAKLLEGIAACIQ